MSRISDALIGIEELAIQGYAPEQIAQVLRVPIEWCWDVWERCNGAPNECSHIDSTSV